MNQEKELDKQNSKTRKLPKVYKYLFVLSSAMVILLTIMQVFHISLFGKAIIYNRYLYLLIGLLLPFSFIVYPAGKNSKNKIPWYDNVLCIVTFACALYFAYHGMTIILSAWEFNAPLLATIISIILWALILEALRRSAGPILAGVVLIFSIYPLFAPYMPTWISGQGFNLIDTAKYHILSEQSAIGLPLKVFSELVVGFLIFGVTLQATGGGKFFMDLALSLMGRMRGGPAKVAVVSSAFMGSISGSVISNIITTGSVTIPTMKKSGYDSETAAAIETCSSTGGVLMPPVMGATAFIMASFLSVPYVEIVIAAAIPAILYYFSLFLQVDCYAAIKGIKGITDETQIPSLRATLKNGWYYLFSIALLVYLLFYLQVEAWAPYYASIVLLACGIVKREFILTISNIFEFIIDNGKVLLELVSILTGVGLIIGALSLTGMAQAFSRELVFLAGGNVALLLLLGALTSFILGFGMTVTAAYVFLAVVLVPALTSLGMNPMGVHLFVFYWGMLSYITPPVALGAYTAASIAGSNAIKTGFQAVKIGIIIYFLPFFFVLSPQVILQEGISLAVLMDIILVVVGIVSLICGISGYLYVIGELKKLFPVI
jgi:TRAP transporter 4TM/12TM fusion protein